MHHLTLSIHHRVNIYKIFSQHFLQQTIHPLTQFLASSSQFAQATDLDCRPRCDLDLDTEAATAPALPPSPLVRTTNGGTFDTGRLLQFDVTLPFS